jgi:HEAT repeats
VVGVQHRWTESTRDYGVSWADETPSWYVRTVEGCEMGHEVTSRVARVGLAAMVLWTWGAWAPHPAWSAPGTPAKGADLASPGEAPLSAASLAKLKSTELEVVRAGLDDARLSGKKAAAAVPAITALLMNGLPYPLAVAALDTLGDIESPQASPAVALYTRHRDPTVRRAAVVALAKTQGAAAAPALRAALSDPDGRVRASAATGLAALKAKVAVPDLFLALDHRVFEAAVSLGQLCEPVECDALLTRLGKVPFDVMTTGIDPILFRPTAELSDDFKVAVVNKVRDLGTREANTFLKAVAARWPKKGSTKVKGALDAAVLATMASPGGG